MRTTNAQTATEPELTGLAVPASMGYRATVLNALLRTVLEDPLNTMPSIYIAGPMAGKPLYNFPVYELIDGAMWRWMHE